MNFQNIFHENALRIEFIDLRSGYNSNFCNLRNNLNDFFIFDIRSRKKSDRNLKILDAFESVFTRIKKEEEFVLINDGSWKYQFLKVFFERFEIRFETKEWAIQNHLHYSAQFAEFEFDSLELANLACYGFETEKVVVFPDFYFRLVNAFAGTANPAYWTYVENERYHIFNEFCRKHNLRIIWNFFKTSDIFYLAVFNENLANALTEGWISFDQWMRSQLKYHACPTEKKESELLFNSRNFKHQTRSMAQGAYPLHCLYEILGRSFKGNEFYLNIYD